MSMMCHLMKDCELIKEYYRSNEWNREVLLIILQHFNSNI